MKKPLVSVFLPYYNDEMYIKDCINSILNQTYTNWELFLFNHASTDNSRLIAHSYDDDRIKHVDAKNNLGAGSGYNLKITLPLMQGKYVKLFCADDVLKPNALELLVNKMEANPEKDFILADMDFVDENLKDLNIKWSESIPYADFESNEYKTLLKFFKGYSHLAYPTALIKRNVLLNVKIDSTFVMLFDVSLWIRLLINGYKILLYDKSVVNYRISKNQLSSINNSLKAGKMGFFELAQLLNIYYEITDVNLTKFLCPCEYSKSLTINDQYYIPFIFSYFFASITQRNLFTYFKDQLPTRELFGTTKLWELLQNDDYKNALYQKFNFGIKEFRDIYSYLHLPSTQKQHIKDKIYNKRAKDLSILQIIYLLGRKIFNLLSPTYYIHKMRKNKNKRYTV